MSTETTPTPAPETTADSEDYSLGRPPENLPCIEPAPASRKTGLEAVKIVNVDLSKKKERALFLDMADPIYAGDPNYISALRMHFMGFLDPAKNPAFEHLDYKAMFAMKDGKPVARIVAHIDRDYNAFHETKSGFFGFFESIDDETIAHALLDAGCSWLREQGMVEVFGPMNFTTNHQCGMLVENFDRPPYVENTYNPPYYDRLLATYGFGKAKDLLIWMIDTKDGMDTPRRKRIKKIADRIAKREGVTVRPVNLKDAEAEIKRMYDMYVAAWGKNWGFVPPSMKEFQFLMADLKTVAIPELVLYIEHEGQPVAFTATLPNVNEHMPKNGRLFPTNWLKMLNLKKTKTGRLITLGTIPKFRKRGLESIMFSETFLAAQKLGWTEGEVGWTLEDNDMVNRAIESMDGTLDRRYRIYGLELTPKAEA